MLTSAILAFAYTLVGWASLQVTVPPDYISVAFPPAGIALAALLIFGNGVWPGIYVGSLLVQLIAGIQSGLVDYTLTALIPPLGAVTQALAGAALARSLIGFPNTLDAPRSIILLLFVVAPVSALINPTLSVPLLVALDLIPADEGVSSWMHWWLGDTLGILLAIPLMFVFFGRPRETWRSRRIAITLPLLATCLLTALVFSEIRSGEEGRIQSQFNREAEGLASLLDKRLSAQIEMILATERFAALNNDFSREDFRDFVQPILARHEGSFNFTWNPLIKEAGRSAFEARSSAELGTPYRIVQRDDNSPTRTSLAAAKAEYFPILFVEPIASNRAILGLEPTSIEAGARAISLSRTKSVPVASEPFTLTQERAGQLGVVIYHAVVRDGAENTLAGIVSNAFRMDDILQHTFARVADVKIEACLVDMSTANGPMRISGVVGCEHSAWAEGPLALIRPIDFATRTWQVRLRASPDYFGERQSWAGWLSIVIGVLATAILGAFLLITTGNTRRIQHLVDMRTAELAETSRDLLKEKRTLSRAQNIARMGSWEIDAASGRVICSDGLRALLPLPDGDEMSLAGLLELFVADDRKVLMDAITQVSAGQSPRGCDCRTNEQLPRIMHVLIEGEWHEGTLVRIDGTAQDVTAARRAEHDITQLALYDALTGLPNRSHWMRHARSAIKIAQRHDDKLAVLFLDLDQFKTVNDSLGHAIGDRLLTTVASRLVGCVRENDMLARLGGDEFVALLSRLNDDGDAATVARKMLTVLSEVIVIEQHELNLSVSIGIAQYPADGSEIDTLLKHADIAMYSAKDGGRNNYQYFVPEMNVRALDRLMIESGLRRALERDELALHYQAQIDTRNGRTIGVEALLRWDHPEMGSVAPDRFIPIAENCGLISPLGAWVMHAAFCQQAAWARQGWSNLVVAVNISALQFRKPDFVDTVRDLLAETGATANLIELEITESALMQPGDELLERLNQLVQMGIKLSLDDFGTGYSSLAYLKRLPISRLKLDKSFVRDLPGDAEDAAIASAAISMARDLGLEVVAEGVETGAQRAYLAERGCTIMQGYLFSHPVPASELTHQLSADEAPGIARS